MNKLLNKAMLKRRYECFKHGHVLEVIKADRIDVIRKRNKSPDRLIKGVVKCKRCHKKEVVYANLNDL